MMWLDLLYSSLPYIFSLFINLACSNLNRRYIETVIRSALPSNLPLSAIKEYVHLSIDINIRVCLWATLTGSLFAFLIILIKTDTIRQFGILAVIFFLVIIYILGLRLPSIPGGLLTVTNPEIGKPEGRWILHISNLCIVLLWILTLFAEYISTQFLRASSTLPTP